jgi:hypothetical protein
MFTTSGTYPWSFVTQIFHNGQPSHGGDRKTFEWKNVHTLYMFFFYIDMFYKSSQHYMNQVCRAWN